MRFFEDSRGSSPDLILIMPQRRLGVSNTNYYEKVIFDGCYCVYNPINERTRRV